VEVVFLDKVVTVGTSTIRTRPKVVPAVEVLVQEAKI
jgi:hypothetical protein